MTAPTTRQRKPVVLLRPVPGRSVIHELWAGTKLIVVAGIGVLLTFYPGWVPIGLVAVLVLTTAWLARIPRGALPSIPRWLWILLFLGGVTATFAGGSPIIELGSVEVGLGGLFNFLRITALSIVLLGLGAMVSWTTNVAEIAPAIATLGRPLRPLRVPIDDWAVAVALALRAFPMLIDEFRVLYAARRLRPKQRPPTRRGRLRHWWAGCHRPARRDDHRGAAASRRDGRRDHRTRWGGSDLGGAVPAESDRLGGACGGHRGVWHGAGAGTHGAGHQLALGGVHGPLRWSA